MGSLVSIITPAFNSDKFIGAAILSVKNQPYNNWEMIIVDDCSSDDTARIVEMASLVDPRIRLIKLDQNSGAGVARDVAVANSKGKYIAFLDADDLWKPTKLEKQIAFMENNDLHFTFSFYDCIDEDGKSLNRTIEAPLRLSYRQLFFCNYIGNLTGIYNADYFGRLSISSVRKRQDWILWLTILKKIKTARPVPESLACYRVRRDSVSAGKTALLRHNFQVYRNYHQLWLIPALCCMFGFLWAQLLIKPRFTKNIR